MTFFLLASIFPIFSVFSSKVNLLDLTLYILISSLFLFILMFNFLGVMWQPLITCIMYTSGILVIYVILSSLSSRSFSYKVKLPFFFFFFLYLVFFLECNYFSYSSPSNILFFLSKGYLMNFSIFLFLFYFFSFVSCISEKNYSIRSFYICL